MMVNGCQPFVNVMNVIINCEYIWYAYAKCDNEFESEWIWNEEYLE